MIAILGFSAIIGAATVVRIPQSAVSSSGAAAGAVLHSGDCRRETAQHVPHIETSRDVNTYQNCRPFLHVEKEHDMHWNPVQLGCLYHPA